MSGATVAVVAGMMGLGAAIGFALLRLFGYHFLWLAAVVAVASLGAFAIGGWLAPNPENEDLTEWEEGA